MSFVSIASGPSAFPEASSLDALLESNDFGLLTDALNKSLQDCRDPRAVNWCVEHGYRRGHVPVLFVLAHNQLRFGKGRVPTVEDVEFGFQVSCILLLRVAQDVQSCKLDMANLSRADTYMCVLSYVSHWALRWNADVVPSTASVADAVELWYRGRRGDLPLPTWATCFSKWLFSIYWGKPDDAHVAAFRRCATVTDTRDAVAVSFVARLRTSSSWHDFLKTDMTN